ncbi:MAG: hypothetical protein ACFFEE_01985, partial [Candidatus Thorarchaeota archaeon]
MKQVWNKIGLFVALIIVLNVGIPKASTQDITIIMKYDHGLIADSGEVSNVPYVWQELNGFCYWATLSMALQSIGVQLDLAEVFAA